jgi:hypothetical protein
MASGLDQTRCNDVLAWLNAGTAPPTITTPIKLRLYTVVGSDASSGTELSTSAGYTAGGKTVTFAAASAGSQSSNADVSWTNMPAATIVAVETWDSNATPKRTFWGNLTANKTTNAGDTLTVSSGTYTTTLT